MITRHHLDPVTAIFLRQIIPLGGNIMDADRNQHFRAVLLVDLAGQKLLRTAGKGRQQ
jgi:hypothetical protein